MKDTQRHMVDGLAVYIDGAAYTPVVFMTHSILSSSAMWDRQAALLVSRGWRVVRIDTRGHGASRDAGAVDSMNGLVADTVAVLDALGLERVHYVGLSLGAMSGIGLALDHPTRVASALLCDTRADAPPDYAAPWDERIAFVASRGTSELARPTFERWFGKTFIDAHPEVLQRFNEMAAQTSAEGFIGCARAIQKLDYLARIADFAVPTTLLVGANDGALPAAMRELQHHIHGAALDVIPDAGHLPNIDQADAFDAALLRHLERVTA